MSKQISPPKVMYRPRPAGSLKASVAELVDHVGGLKRAADLTDRSVAQMARYTDDHHPDQMTVNQVRLLEREAGQPIVTRFLAAEADHVLLHVVPLGSDAIDLDFARIGAGVGHLFEGYAEALSDRHSPGKVDGREAGRLIELTDHLMSVMAAAREKLRARTEGDTAKLKAVQP